MKTSAEFKQQFKAFLEDAYQVSADMGRELEDILREGWENPLSEEEIRRLLTTVVKALKRRAVEKGDTRAAKNLGRPVSEIVEDIMKARGRARGKGSAGGRQKLQLLARNGTSPGPVSPKRYFHTREIPMQSGYVKTSDIKLWANNERLDIHLSQFRQKYGHEPTHEELLRIMLTEMPLPGVSEKDEFKIMALANSISVNGVRVPPIVDVDGTLLDGNRRVAACYYILNSREFTAEQKARVEYTFVWQLTEYATEDDRKAVIVSLNFEEDHKQSWPEYVKAWQVYNQWQTMLALEPRRPGPDRERELKRELSRMFALGRDATDVNRYIRMVEWATDFQDYFVSERGRDEYEVKHRASEYFQYFDELSKGVNSPGVAHMLSRDDTFKHLVFDLLFQGKFKNWTLIRSLRYADPDVRDRLKAARDNDDIEEAQDLVEDALSDAKARSREARVVGANERIKSFATWLEKLPISAFSNPSEIQPENVQRLLDALRLVEKLVVPGEQQAEA